MITTAAVIFLLASGTGNVEGVWQVTSPKVPDKVFHIVVDEANNIVFDEDRWYPQKVWDPEVSGSRVDFGMFLLERPEVPVHVTFTTEGESGAGTIAMNFPQFPVTLEIEGTRVLPTALPPLHELVENVRVGGRIDMISFLEAEAPRSDFAAFETFWNERFVPRFYPLLSELLQNRGPMQFDPNVLKGIQDRISDLVSARDRFLRERPALTTEGCLVLVPKLVDRPDFVTSLASIKTVFPPGHTICCGDKEYQEERFQIKQISVE